MIDGFGILTTSVDVKKEEAEAVVRLVVAKAKDNDDADALLKILGLIPDPDALGVVHHHDSKRRRALRKSSVE